MIKIGQIGMAHDHAEGKMSCVRKFPDIFEIVGVAEENRENIRLFGGQTGYQNLRIMSVDELLSVPGLDAVMVETEELSLVHTAQRCLDSGVHIHMDKPAGSNVEDFERLLSVAKRKNLIVQLAYMYRYNPAVQFCANAVKNGKLGEIFRVQAIMNSYHPPEKRAWMKQFPGGNMFYLGCHMVDLVIMLMGVPDKITSLCKSTGFDSVDAVDTGFAVFEYKRGIATVEASSNDVNGYGRRSLLVCGNLGSIEIRPLEGKNFTPELTISLREKVDGHEHTSYQCVTSLPTVTGRYDSMMLDFARMVNAGEENPFNYEYELLVQKATLAACGMPINVESTDI